MRIHELKIGANYLENLISGVKKSEIRLNDRDYQLGDILEFPQQTAFKFKITHIHSGLGLQNEYVVLSLENIGTTLK